MRERESLTRLSSWSVPESTGRKCNGGIVAVAMSHFVWRLVDGADHGMEHGHPFELMYKPMT